MLLLRPSAALIAMNNDGLSVVLYRLVMQVDAMLNRSASRIFSLNLVGVFEARGISSAYPD